MSEYQCPDCGDTSGRCTCEEQRQLLDEIVLDEIDYEEKVRGSLDERIMRLYDEDDAYWDADGEGED